MGLLTTIRDKETLLVFPENFSGARRTVIQVLRAHFYGVLGKSVFLRWCFDGEVVVECVANVVPKMALIQSRKTCHILQVYFRGSVSLSRAQLAKSRVSYHSHLLPLHLSHAR